MKVLIGAVAAAALMLGSVAEAQTTTTTAPAAPAAAVPASRCPAAIAPPAGPPDGATVDQRAMAAAQQAYLAWDTAFREVLECRLAEHEEVVATMHAREAEYNAMVESRNATNTAWKAASDTFCARRGIRCNSEAQSNAHH